MRFKSKKGIIFFPFLIIITLHMLYLALTEIINGAYHGVILIAIAGLIIWLLISTAYTIEKGVLHVRAAFIHRSIPINSIISVRPTFNPLSSPALSLDRLEINYQSGMVVDRIFISPQNRDHFIAALQETNPAIKVLKRK
ncbi:PH domain-containing protein [Bacillus sp. PS06]|uniref:PH domain-containing protein n=1 Tax=Bacillus sp. PS06 TaxID=2764176 RepID=UPI0017865D20|nr:PH domain-containing protein [Bacillus sp. PS06]MBD8069072.1 PH domain-containing protein [Bacillus sp. PS06]